MAKQVQFRRGTTAEHSTFTGAKGEITVDTTKKVVVVHDGLTVGGLPGARASDITAANTAIAGLQSTVNLLRLDVNALDPTGASTEQAKLRANIAAANVQISNLNSNAAVQSIAIDTLTQNLQGANSVAVSQSIRITSTELRLDTVEADILGTNASIVNLTGIVASNAAAQSVELAGLRANITAANSVVISLLGNAFSQETEISTLRTDLTAANLAIISAYNRVDAANVSIEQVSNRLTAANLVIDAGTANAAAQSVELSGLRANIIAANAQTELQFNTITANLVSRIDEAAALRANITAANSSIVTANTALKSYLDDRFTSLINGAPGVLDTLNELSAALANDANFSTTVTNLVANVQSNVTAANAKISTLQSGLDTTNNAVLNAYDRVDAANLRVNAANLSIALTNSNVAAANTAIGSLRANITAANAAIDTFNIGLSNAYDRVDAANLRVNSANLSIGIVNANVSAANSAISTNTARVAAANVEIGKLQANITAANASIVDLQSNIAAANAAILTNTNRVAAANVEIGKLQANIAAANAVIASIDFAAINSVTDLRGNILANNYVYATGLTSNTAITSVGNITGGNVIAITSLSAPQAFVTNMTVATDANVTGNVIAGNVNTTGNINLTSLASTLRFIRSPDVGVIAGEIYGTIDFAGEDSSLDSAGVRARVQTVAIDTNGGTSVEISTASANSPTLTKRLTANVNGTYSSGSMYVGPLDYASIGSTGQISYLTYKPPYAPIADFPVTGAASYTKNLRIDYGYGNFGSQYTITGDLRQGPTDVTANINLSAYSSLIGASIFDSSIPGTVDLDIWVTGNHRVDATGAYLMRLRKRWIASCVYWTGNTQYTILDQQLTETAYNSDGTNFAAGAVNAGKVYLQANVNAGSTALYLRFDNKTTPLANSVTSWTYSITARRTITY